MALASFQDPASEVQSLHRPRALCISALGAAAPRRGGELCPPQERGLARRVGTAVSS